MASKFRQGAARADTKTELLTLTTEVVAAHVGSNAVAIDQIPSLIKEVLPDLEKRRAWVSGSPYHGSRIPKR